jgi:hypothetical protein
MVLQQSIEIYVRGFGEVSFFEIGSVEFGFVGLGLGSL